MDFSEIGKTIKELYNCTAIGITKYEDNYVVNCVETKNEIPHYRYFMLKDGVPVEIVDSDLIITFNKRHEHKSDIIYR